MPEQLRCNPSRQSRRWRPAPTKPWATYSPDLARQLAQPLDNGRIPPLRQNPPRLARQRLVRFQRQRRQACSLVHSASGLGLCRAEHTAGAREKCDRSAHWCGPNGVGIGMRRALVVPVANVHRAVGANRHVAGRKPGVVRQQQVALLACGKRRAARRQRVPVDGMPQQIGRDVLAAKTFRKRIALIDDAAHRDVPAAQDSRAARGRSSRRRKDCAAHRACRTASSSRPPARRAASRSRHSWSSRTSCRAASKSRPQELPPPSQNNSKRRDIG